MKMLCEDSGNRRFVASEINLNGKLLMESLIDLRNIAKYLTEYDQESEIYSKLNETWVNINIIIQSTNSICEVYKCRDEESEKHPGEIFDISTCHYKRNIHTNIADIYLGACELEDIFKSLTESSPIIESEDELQSKYGKEFDKCVEFIKQISDLINPIYESINEEDPEMKFIK